MMNTNSLAPETLLHCRYKIGKVIGHGGTGIVYSAFDMIQNIEVAIKELFPSSCCTRERNQKYIYPYSNNAKMQYQRFKDSFIREAKLMSDLSKCPNLPVLYDLFEENNTWYCAMELLNGITLKQYLGSSGAPLLESDVFYIATKILRTLSYMHQQNVIHRDICSDNIFLTGSNKVLLIDLSSAVTYNDKESLLVMVRKGYAPPEQYQVDGLLGPWTDIYALGAVMYEALTGKRVTESIERQQRDEILQPKLFNKYITDSMNSAIIKALSLDTKNRFQTAEEFQKYLESGNNARSKIRKYIYILIWLVFLVLGCAFALFKTQLM